MAFSSSCITLVLLAMAAYPLQAHARESWFFSKVGRAEPQTTNPKAETKQALPPSAPPFKEATPEQGYGLFGKEETYQYPPTTTNPTKSEPGKFKYLRPNGYPYGAGEKQGMSDTRFLENGRYFYDLQKENDEAGYDGRLKENNDGHETYYGSESGKQYMVERYETGEKQGKSYITGENQGKSYITGEKQGMSDTRFLENGRYFYDIDAEEKKNNGYPNNAEFYSNNKYGSEKGEEEEDKYEDELYGSGEKQGMSDARFADNGRYHHDLKGQNSGQYNEAPNGVDFYKNEKTNEYSEKESYVSEKSGYEGESYRNNNQKENWKYNGKFGKGYDFKTTPNKFPNYEFDSIEEYEKYEQGRSHQKEYAP